MIGCGLPTCTRTPQVRSAARVPEVPQRCEPTSSESRLERPQFVDTRSWTFPLQPAGPLSTDALRCGCMLHRRPGRCEQAMSVGTPPSLSLRKSAAQGAKWTSASAVVTVILQLIQVVVLARLLTPSEFGLAALAVAIITFGALLTDAGISSAIIARQTTSREVLSSLYWTNVLTGILAFGLAAALAPMIADALGQPELTNLLLLGDVMFLFGPIGQQFRIVFQRDLRFRTLGAIDILSSAAAAAAAIVAAALGFGAGALVIGVLTLNCCGSLLCGLYGWRIAPLQLRFRWAEVRDYLAFGAYLLGQRLCGYAAYNVDYLIIGKALGTAALGPYAIAFQLVVRPQVQLNSILTRVGFPLFARRQGDDAALVRGFTELSRLVALASFPALLGLAAVAPNFVPAVLGPEWPEAVTLVQILAVLGAIRALTQPAGWVLLAKDRPEAAFWVSVVSLVAVGVAVLIGVQFDIVTASWAHVIAVGGVFAFQALVLQRIIQLAPRLYLRSLAKPALISMTMGIAVIGVGRMVDFAGASPMIGLIVQVATGVAVYGLLLSMFYSAYLRDVRGLLRATPRGTVASK